MSNRYIIYTYLYTYIQKKLKKKIIVIFNKKIYIKYNIYNNK